ncbi:pheromone-binding protein-related protein 6-like [Zerene cesonia]|uniref:pheromone-binding protein-related protein 6-like n=1 Tax=Zerene cesonia TaxID=33412 RepID=UPI0018E51980|nr:pheromone-binding protein-related protein 6-like [Zerene cesonia]
MSAALLITLIVFVTCGHGAKEKPELSDEIKEIIEHVHNECVGLTGVAEEDIANCENGIFKEDNKLKCYMFCLLEEGSLVDDDGNVDYDMMISLIPEQYTERVTKMITACKHLDTKDKDKCQRAFDVHQCSYKQDPDVSFLYKSIKHMKKQAHVKTIFIFSFISSSNISIIQTE